MTATILDGKKLAATVRAEVKGGVARFTKEHGRAPGLEVILVGEDPASMVYTRNKEKASIEVGMRGQRLELGHRIEQLEHHETHVAQGRGVGGHGNSGRCREYKPVLYRMFVKMARFCPQTQQIRRVPGLPNWHVASNLRNRCCSATLTACDPGAEW